MVVSSDQELTQLKVTVWRSPAEGHGIHPFPGRLGFQKSKAEPAVYSSPCVLFPKLPMTSSTWFEYRVQARTWEE